MPEEKTVLQLLFPPVLENNLGTVTVPLLHPPSFHCTIALTLNYFTFANPFSNLSCKQAIEVQILIIALEELFAKLLLMSLLNELS